MMGFLTSTDADDRRCHMRAAAFTFCTLLLLIGGLSVALWPKAQSLTDASDIRVCNATGVALSGVRIDGVDYGDIGAGVTTQYLKHRHAGEYAGYRLIIDGVLVQSNPMIIVKTLGPGNFTYVIHASEPFDSHGEKKRHVWVRLEPGLHDLADPAA
jgi:hypothetical protein